MPCKRRGKPISRRSRRPMQFCATLRAVFHTPTAHFESRRPAGYKKSPTRDIWALSKNTTRGLRTPESATEVLPCFRVAPPSNPAKRFGRSKRRGHENYTVATRIPASAAFPRGWNVSGTAPQSICIYGPEASKSRPGEIVVDVPPFRCRVRQFIAIPRKSRDGSPFKRLSALAAQLRW